MTATNAYGWPKERADGTVVWATGTRHLLPPGECDYCDRMREVPGGPSHDGSKTCRGFPYSIAKVGPEGRAHCTCDGCF